MAEDTFTEESGGSSWESVAPVRPGLAAAGASDSGFLKVADAQRRLHSPCSSRCLSPAHPSPSTILVDPRHLISPHNPLHREARGGQEGERNTIQANKPLVSQQQKWGMEQGREKRENTLGVLLVGEGVDVGNSLVAVREPGSGPASGTGLLHCLCILGHVRVQMLLTGRGASGKVAEGDLARGL